MTAPRLTLTAWRSLVCIVAGDADDLTSACPCTERSEAELTTAGLITPNGEATPAGLVAYGRLQHARRTC